VYRAWTRTDHQLPAFHSEARRRVLRPVKAQELAQRRSDAERTCPTPPRLRASAGVFRSRAKPQRFSGKQQKVPRCIERELRRISSYPPFIPKFGEEFFVRLKLRSSRRGAVTQRRPARLLRASAPLREISDLERNRSVSAGNSIKSPRRIDRGLGSTSSYPPFIPKFGEEFFVQFKLRSSRGGAVAQRRRARLLRVSAPLREFPDPERNRSVSAGSRRKSPGVASVDSDGSAATRLSFRSSAKSFFVRFKLRSSRRGAVTQKRPARLLCASAPLREFSDLVRNRSVSAGDRNPVGFFGALGMPLSGKPFRRPLRRSSPRRSSRRSAPRRSRPCAPSL
jgi:hypothetical protein